MVALVVVNYHVILRQVLNTTTIINNNINKIIYHIPRSLSARRKKTRQIIIIIFVYIKVTIIAIRNCNGMGHIL